MIKREKIKGDTALAKYLGRSLRQVNYYKNPRNKRAEALPNPLLDGSYYKDEIDAWVENREKKRTGQKRQQDRYNPTGKIDYEFSNDLEKKLKFEADLKESKAQIEQLRLEEIQGELIRADAVHDEWVNRIIELKTGLLSFSKKLPPLLEGLGKREMQIILEQEIRFLLLQYSRDGQ
jgi:hypothetical protein